MKYQLSSTAHLLTINVEEWYRDPSVSSSSRDGAGDASARAAGLMERMVDELAASRTKATFFVPESVAQTQGSALRAAVRAGHDVAALGTYAGLDADEFRDDARRVRSAIEQATGVRVHGFRSPATGPWRFDALVEEGFEYDSSRTSGKSWGGDVPDYAQTIMCGAGSLIEVPLPRGMAGGGLSLRRLPYATLWGAFAERAQAGLPSVLSVSIWEMDDAQPRHPLPMLTALRHYSGRRVARERFARLLRDFRFDAVGHRLSELAKDAPFAYAA